MALEALRRNGHHLDLHQFDTVGSYDVPILQPVTMLQPFHWIPFNCAMTDSDRAQHGVHFFIDDYLFDRTWNDPGRYAQLLSQFGAVMTPDFSLFTDYPKAVQIYNHYRKHLLGAFWQSLGMTVIPSICWSDQDSFDWCFDGEPTDGIVAVSSVGTQKSPQARELFLAGYEEMMSCLRPRKVVFFGDVPPGCGGSIEQHAAFYTTVNKSRK